MKQRLSPTIYFTLIIFLSLPFFLDWDFGYGPPFDASKVVSAKVAGYGQIGIFTYKKIIYKPATGWRAFPDGGIPLYIKDIDYIAVYDFAKRKIKIVHQESNLKGHWGDGHGEFFVNATYGKKVLVSRGGQRRFDLKSEHLFYWLELDSGRLMELPLAEELAQRGLEVGYLYLIDEVGTLILVAPSLGSSPNWTRDMKVNPHLLIRHSNGDYEDITRIVPYYGVKNKDVHYWSSDNKYMVYNFENKTYRTGERNEYPTVSSEPKNS